MRTDSPGYVWHSTFLNFYQAATNTTLLLDKHAEEWQVPLAMRETAKKYLADLAPYNTRDRLIFSSNQLGKRDKIKLKAHTFFLYEVRPWVLREQAQGVISQGMSSRMHFSLPARMRHNKCPIPQHKIYFNVKSTGIDHVKFTVKHPFDSDGVIHHKGSVWPRQVCGACIAYRPLHSTSDWTYRYVTRLHNWLVMPSEWRGQLVVFQAAYIAHTDDSHEQLTWSEPTPIYLAKPVDLQGKD